MPPRGHNGAEPAQPALPGIDMGFAVPPAPARRAGALAIESQMAHLISQAIRESGKDRTQIAADMSFLLGRPVTKAALDGFSSESKEDRQISVLRLLALIQVCNAHWVLDELARKIGARVLVGEEILWAAKGAIDSQIEELRARRDELGRLAPAAPAAKRRR